MLGATLIANIDDSVTPSVRTSDPEDGLAIFDTDSASTEDDE
jgi:hypothetical protein